jgi:transposase
MMPVPSGVQVRLASGHTDMRKGFDGLWRYWCRRRSSAIPRNGHLFVFRGRRSALIKVLWHDGQGMCLFAKSLERGRFVWPSTVPPDRGWPARPPAHVLFSKYGLHLPLSRQSNV